MQGKPEPHMQMILVHAGNPDLASIKERNRNLAGTSVKKVPADTMRDLLEELADLGFFDMAGESGEGSKRIDVTIASRTWSLSTSPGMSIEERNRFNEMLFLIRRCHDSIIDLQIIDNPQGSDLFYEQQKRLQREAEKTGLRNR